MTRAISAILAVPAFFLDAPAWVMIVEGVVIAGTITALVLMRQRGDRLACGHRARAARACGHRARAARRPASGIGLISEDTVEAFLNRVRQAWDAADAHEYAMQFSEDASYVIFMGDAMSGVRPGTGGTGQGLPRARRAAQNTTRAIMGAVDNSHYSLVIAAAQAAGPCPPGEEAAWGRRVHGLTVDLHLIAQQARQDIERLESARTFIAFLEKVEIEESSRRGLLTLRLASGESEPIRTEQKDTDRGRALIERARSLQGRWVLVYRYNERKAGQRNQSVRMLAHLMDLGVDGAVPNTTAKKIVLQEADGDMARAQEAWIAAGLPGTGPISVDQLEQARGAAREAR